MEQLLDTAKRFIEGLIKEDDVLVDFTMGNGYDTLYLCSLVPKGRVYAFDIQKDALENTAARLEKAGYTNASLILDSHANVKNYVTAFKCGMFNLGYRPGGDKTVHTMRSSTLKAVSDAIEIMEKGGTLVISVYPGHAEGSAEGDALYEMLRQYDKKYYSVVCHRMINSSDCPFIFAVEKYDK